MIHTYNSLAKPAAASSASAVSSFHALIFDIIYTNTSLFPFPLDASNKTSRRWNLGFNVLSEEGGNQFSSSCFLSNLALYSIGSLGFAFLFSGVFCWFAEQYCLGHGDVWGILSTSLLVNQGVKKRGSFLISITIL